MSSSTNARQLIHTRQINTQIFRRDDGLWDIEASLLDTKGKDFHLASGVKEKGEPIHHMVLTVTIDTHFNVLAANAKSISVPYPGHCDTIETEYSKLVGLNLLSGFRKAIKELFEGVKGCSHISELCTVIPTVAIQGFAGEVFQLGEREGENHQEMPFQLNRCHALRTDGPAVKKYYKTWFGQEVRPTDLPKKKNS